MLGVAVVAFAPVMASARWRCGRETRDWGAIAVAGEIAVAGVAAAALTLGPALPRVPRPRPPATRARCHER